ncbi:4'-phosphopantetheinyl transferase superfamily protein [Xanthobacter sp. V4C-4]|uniref:4'-phosphopantetheinyl transferase family protein n=1 Tax=Xanthobacter cornucopiae TaxID=3119924 RepID=UPI00372BC9B0
MIDPLDATRRLDAFVAASVSSDGGAVVAAPAAWVNAVLAPGRWLPACERARIMRHLHAEDRAARLAAWGLARRMIGHLTGRPAATLEMVRDANGRPRVAGAAMLDFNLSHGAGWVAVGLTGGARIGVDVDGARAVGVWDELAPAVLAEDARARWRALEPEVRARAALALWCVKEAVLKATGEGLAGDPRTVPAPAPGTCGGLMRGGRDYMAGSAALGVAHCLGFAVAAPVPPRLLVWSDARPADRA